MRLTTTTLKTVSTTSATSTTTVPNPNAFCAHRFQLTVSAGSCTVQVQASIDNSNWVDLLDSALAGTGGAVTAGQAMAIVTGRFSYLRVNVSAASGWTGTVLLEQYGDEREAVL